MLEADIRHNQARRPLSNVLFWDFHQPKWTFLFAHEKQTGRRTPGLWRNQPEPIRRAVL